MYVITLQINFVTYTSVYFIKDYFDIHCKIVENYTSNKESFLEHYEVIKYGQA